MIFTKRERMITLGLRLRTLFNTSRVQTLTI